MSTWVERFVGDRVLEGGAVSPTHHRPLSELQSDVAAVTAVEYGLIAGLIAMVIVSSVTNLGMNIAMKLSAVSSLIAAASK